jgi:hypothetical protein
MLDQKIRSGGVDVMNYDWLVMTPKNEGFLIRSGILYDRRDQTLLYWVHDTKGRKTRVVDEVRYYYSGVTPEAVHGASQAGRIDALLRYGAKLDRKTRG